MGDYRDYDNYGPMIVSPDYDESGDFTYYANPLWDNDRQAIMTFEEVYSQYSEKEITTRLNWEIYNKRLPFGRLRHTVRHPTSYWITDIYIKKITYTRIDQFSFVTDFIIIAAIDVIGMEEQDTARQWYRYRIITNFKDGFARYSESVSVYDPKKNHKGTPLSEYLVPYLKTEQMDSEIYDLLNIYYKEAFDTLCKPDMFLLVQRMGFTIRYARLSPTGTITKGKTVFDESEVLLYDDRGNAYVEIVDAKTILIDRDANIQNGYDSTEDTIAHEIIHIYEHYLFYGLQKVYSDSLGVVGLDIDKLSYDNRCSEPVEWIERQARAMTMRLRMPINTVAYKFAEFHKYNLLRTNDKLTVLELTVCDIASFFGVSKTSAKNRLLSIGVTDVRGVLVYCDGRYVPNHMWAADTDHNTTFTIDKKSLDILCESDTRLKMILELEMFVYAEGHVCINEERFVKKINGSYSLTKLGRCCIDRCCLAFERKYECVEYEYQYGALNHIDKRGMTAFVLGKDSISNVYDEAEIMQDIPRGLPEEFIETLEEHIEKSGYSAKDLADTTYIDSERIRKIRKRKVQFVSLEEVVALGIGLGLQPEQIYDLVDKSTDKKRNTFRHNVIYVLVRKYYMYPIDTINHALLDLNEEPLTKAP